MLLVLVAHPNRKTDSPRWTWGARSTEGAGDWQLQRIPDPAARCGRLQWDCGWLRDDSTSQMGLRNVPATRVTASTVERAFEPVLTKRGDADTSILGPVSRSLNLLPTSYSTLLTALNNYRYYQRQFQYHLIPSIPLSRTVSVKLDRAQRQVSSFTTSWFTSPTFQVKIIDQLWE
jgi:hypothetical protein